MWDRASKEEIGERDRVWQVSRVEELDRGTETVHKKEIHNYNARASNLLFLSTAHYYFLQIGSKEYRTR